MTRTLLGVIVAAVVLGSGPSAAAPGTRAVPDIQAPPSTQAPPSAAAMSSTPAAAGSVRYSAPLPDPLRVVRGFDPPLVSYGAGHLGVDVATARSQLVRSAAAGRVIFAGRVAGRGVIVVAHNDGVSTEYEPVRPAVRAGQLVRRGQVIGQVSGVHGGCAIGGCLHWGARRGASYLDPLSLLKPLGPVRLLPWTQATAPIGAGPRSS